MGRYREHGPYSPEETSGVCLLGDLSLTEGPGRKFLLSCAYYFRHQICPVITVTSGLVFIIGKMGSLPSGRVGFFAGRLPPETMRVFTCLASGSSPSLTLVTSLRDFHGSIRHLVSLTASQRAEDQALAQRLRERSAQRAQLERPRLGVGGNIAVRFPLPPSPLPRTPHSPEIHTPTLTTVTVHPPARVTERPPLIEHRPAFPPPANTRRYLNRRPR